MIRGLHKRLQLRNPTGASSGLTSCASQVAPWEKHESERLFIDCVRSPMRFPVDKGLFSTDGVVVVVVVVVVVDLTSTRIIKSVVTGQAPSGPRIYQG